MTSANELWTVGGIPAHPLLVHAVVVLLPLAAVCAALIAVRPAWRRRFGIPVALLTVVAVAAVPVTQEAGEQLEAKLAMLENPLIAQHAALGGTLLPYAVVFGVLVLALVAVGLAADRPVHAAHSIGPRPTRTPWRVLVAVVAILVVLSGAATVTQVVRIGHSGSVAVWEGVGSQ